MNMLDDSHRNKAADLDDQAEAWVVSMHSGHFTPEESKQLEEWLARNAAHQRAFQNALILWKRMPKALMQKTVRRPHWPVALAASAALLMGVLAVGWYKMKGSTEHVVTQPAPPRPYQTRLGERSTVKLEDGSTLQLNSNTQTLVEITPTRRRIVLKQGQLFAAVAKDSSRPFEVEALNGTTRAIGTEFDVQIDADVVTVVDISGRVSVTPVNTPANEWAALNAGRGLRYSSAGPLGAPFDVDIDSVAAWRSGFWSFENASLENVAKTVRNYHMVFIEFENPRIAQLSLTGRFKIGDLDTLMRTITLTHPVLVKRSAENSFLISSK